MAVQDHLEMSWSVHKQGSSVYTSQGQAVHVLRAVRLHLALRIVFVLCTVPDQSDVAGCREFQVGLASGVKCQPGRHDRIHDQQ